MGITTAQQNKMPKLRFPGFSEPLLSIKLGKLVKVERGGSPRPIQSFMTTAEDGVPWIKIGDISPDGKYITKTEEKIKPEGVYKSREVFPGDFILSNSMSFGRPYIVKIHGCIHDGWLALRNSNADELNNSFLFYLLQSDKTKGTFLSLAAGSAVKNLKSETVKQAFLDIPDYSEQQKIADFLGSVDTWLDNLRSQKTALETYKRGMMQKIFTQQVRFKDDNGNNFPGWETKLLGDIAKISTGNSNREGSTDTGEYRLFDRSTDERWTTDYELDAEALIVAGEGLTFKPRYYSGKFALHQRAYAVINNSSSANWCYLYYFVTFHHQWFRRMAVGTTMPSLRMDAFTKMEISLPDEGEQQKIADFLSATDTMIEAKEQEIDLVEHWKKGLMQKMFI